MKEGGKKKKKKKKHGLYEGESWHLSIRNECGLINLY